MKLRTRLHRRRRAALAMAAAAAVAGGGFLIGGGGGASAGTASTDVGWPVAESAAPALAAPARHRLTIETVEVRAAGVDLAPRGESPGDFFHFEERAFRPGTNRVIGRDAVRCELGIRSFQCNGTIQIDGRGKIVVDGAIMSERDIRIPITGGTGHFAGVGGTLHVVEGRGARTRLVFDFVR